MRPHQPIPHEHRPKNDHSPRRGTYELFRHFYRLRRFTKGKDRPYGAVAVLQTVLQMFSR